MPPSDPNPSMPPSGMPPGMPPGSGMPPSGGMPLGGAGGDVMISMPKGVFDQLHELIRQLASGAEEVAAKVNAEASGAGEMPPEMGGGAPKGGGPEGSPSDADFLQEMVAGSTR